MNNRGRNILIGLVVFITVALIAGIVNIILNMQNTGKYGVSIETVPKSATLKLNGQTMSPGIIPLAPGTYTVTASKEGFQSASRTFTVQPDNVPYVGITLVAETQSAKDSLDNPDEQSNLEAISGKITDENSELATEKSPLIGQLPYLGEGLDYRIDFGVSVDKERTDKGYRAILITAPSKETREAALDWIRSVGEDPSKYEIVFLDYRGPIKGSGGEDYDEHFE